jgi:hypothetical protein
MDEMRSWLRLGGVPLELGDQVAEMLRKECGADQGSAAYAAPLVIDAVRRYVAAGLGIADWMEEPQLEAPSPSGIQG